MSSFSSSEAKEAYRKKLEEDIEKFKKKGGKIKQIPNGHSAQPNGVTTTQIHITKRREDVPHPHPTKNYRSHN